MDMTGEYRITAARQKVWEALNDPTILQQCIPGCEEIQKLSDVEWTAKVTAKVGPVKAKFGGKVTLSELDPPNGYTITGEGTGGAAGFAKGGAVVKLTDDADATRLAYVVQAQVGGKLAQIGSRLIDGASRKMADEFFSRFAEIVGGPPTAAPAAPIAAEAPAAAPASVADAAAAPPVTPPPAATPTAPPRPAPAASAPAAPALEPRRGLSPLVWVIGLAAILAIILALFTR
jgi:carbon monoxide dehydrogenase subunit G